MKDTIIDLYINSSKMLSRLVYYKEYLEKDNNRVTVENIINYMACEFFCSKISKT